MVYTSLVALAAKASRAAPRLRLLKSPVTLTDAAADRIRQLLDKRSKVNHLQEPAGVPRRLQAGASKTFAGGLHTCLHALQEYLKLGIKRRGCNGLAYTLNYAGAHSWEHYHMPCKPLCCAEECWSCMSRICGGVKHQHFSTSTALHHQRSKDFLYSDVVLSTILSVIKKTNTECCWQ
jgi:hypothetical protein